MEYAPAGDLAGFIKAAAAARMPLPEGTIWSILLQLCQGMQVGAVARGGEGICRQQNTESQLC
jgi:hypothetical protein